MLNKEEPEDKTLFAKNNFKPVVSMPGKGKEAPNLITKNMANVYKIRWRRFSNLKQLKKADNI